jgi:hypothetical protein
MLAGRIERALGGTGETHFKQASQRSVNVAMSTCACCAARRLRCQCRRRCGRALRNVQRMAEETEYLGIAAKARLMRGQHLLCAQE